MKFTKFLYEADGDLIAAGDLIAGYLPDKRALRMRDSAAALDRATKEGKIYNAELEELKSSINYDYEHMWRELYYKPVEGGEKDPEDHRGKLFRHMSDADIEPWINGGNYKKQIRLLDAMIGTFKGNDADKKRLQELLKLHQAYGALQDALKALKPNAIKGRKPAEPDPNAFSSKLGSKEAVEKVRKHLLANISGPLDEFAKQMEEHFEDTVHELEGTKEYSSDELDRLLRSYKHQVFTHCFTFETSGWGKTRKYFNVKPSPAAKTWPKAEAKRMRDDMQEGFLAKNIMKISHLLDLKGNLTKVTDLPTKPVKVVAGKGSLEAGFKFEFADGARFTVVNKIIINYSARGAAFYQYPTTFHDVVKADGSKLEAPSEEKMVKGFAA